MAPMLRSPPKLMDSLHSRVTGSKIMDHMPNLLQPIATTPKQRLLLEATPHSNSSMALPMANRHQLDIKPPSPPLIVTTSRPRVMEPALTKALLLLQLLQLLPNPMVLSQDTLPSQHTLAMVNRQPPLPHRVTMLTASHLATTRITTPSLQHMASSSKVTNLSRQAMVSNRGTSSRASSSNRHLLLIPLNLLVHMASLHPTSSVSRVGHPTTASPTTTTTTDRMARVQVLVILAQNPQGTQGQEIEEALGGTALIVVE